MPRTGSKSKAPEYAMNYYKENKEKYKDRSHHAYLVKQHDATDVEIEKYGADLKHLSKFRKSCAFLKEKYPTEFEELIKNM